jgi:hypothetical protein
MDTDLYIGFSVIATIGALVFLLGYFVGRSTK